MNFRGFFFDLRLEYDLDPLCPFLMNKNSGGSD